MSKTEIAFYDGHFGHPKYMKIPLEERGYLFGEGVYEVFLSYNHKLWQEAGHFERLDLSLKALSMRWPYPKAQIKRLIKQGLSKLSGERHSVYLQVTRGAALRQHSYAGLIDRSVLTLIIRTLPPQKPILQNGKAIILPDIRGLFSQVKSTNLVANTLAATAIEQQNVAAAIFVRDNIITEAASQSVCMVKDGIIYTAPPGPLVLDSITRQYVLANAAKWGLQICEQSFSQEQLLAADEVFLLSTSKCPLAILAIDGQIIGDGKIGKQAKRIFDCYQEDLACFINGA